LSSLFQTSPAVIPHARYVRLGIEMEVAVQLGSELHDRPTAANVKACLSQVAAAFELVEDRGADYTQLDACSIISDNSWNAGIVIGEPVAAAALGDLLGRAGVLRRDGEEIGRGLTNDAGGDPLEVVAWLASLLQAQGRPLRAGHWVLTGSIIPTIFPGPGEHYEFSVDGLPPVELQIE
jgi:2-keto-4-pentenoate hydratase